MHEYQAFGMHIVSELSLALPSVPQNQIMPEWQVAIRLGTIPAELPMPHRLGRIRYGEFGTDLQIEVPWAGRYRVFGDSRIDVEPVPSADEQTVGLYITDLILSFLLRRHPFLTLHGSAVSGPQGALVFLGNRGSGKSTTAAAMARSGYKILCDDVVPVAAGPVVFPGIPYPRLLPDAYERLVGDISQASHLFDGIDKYRIELEASHTPALLHGVFILEPAEIGNLEIMPLRGGAKMAAMFPHICSSPGIDDSRNLFSRSIALLGQGPVFKIKRPIAANSLDELIPEIIRIDKETV